MKKPTKPFAFLVALILTACSGGGGEPSTADNTKDRRLILTHWADDIIIPAYEDFGEVLGTMLEASAAFADAPDEASLVAFRQAWRDAYLAWQGVELFAFGPADKYTLRNFFNIYPANVDGIASNIADPSVSLELPASYATQGFPALDYLLNGIGDSDAAIVAAYTTAPDAASRVAYVKRLTQRMETLLTQVVGEWKGQYRDTFVTETGLDIGSSFGRVVNAYVLHYERYVRSGKIGIPSGTAIGSSGVAYPERTEAYYAGGLSRALAEAAHAAARDFFIGVGTRSGAAGPSFKSYLDALGAKDDVSGKLLSDLITEQFDAITAELGQLLPDLSEQIQTNNEPMAETYAAMQKLVRMLKVDMTSAMSITITYTDNDGD